MDDRAALGSTGQNLIRILIASYFLAVSAGVIDGTRIDILLDALMPPIWAEFIGRCVIFTLSFLVLCGLALRISALLTAILVFWASLLVTLNSDNPARVEVFWRDLALIAALMLTYLPGQGRTALHDAAVVRTRRTVRNLKQMVRIAPRRPSQPAAPRREPVLRAAQAKTKFLRLPKPQASNPETDTTNIFAD